MEPQFNPPPNWPATPDPQWRPDPQWQPEPSWPAAPQGWAYWVDGNGEPVDGPAGLYGSNDQNLWMALGEVT